MKKLLNKIFAILIVFSLIGMSFISDLVYASEVIGNEASKDYANASADINASADVNASASASASADVNANASASATSDAVENQMSERLLVDDKITVTNIAGNNGSTKREESENGDAVEFSATISSASKITADINQELIMHVRIYVKKAGYLKDVNISLNEENYIISKSADEINKEIKAKSENISRIKLIREISGNEIKLNEIDGGDALEYDIPIKYKKPVEISPEYLDRESKINLKGIFVNSRNEQQEISRESLIRVQWKIQAEASIKQELIRYIKYNNRTMISLKVTDGIKENVIPIERKEISIEVPKLNNELPMFVSAIGEGIEQKYSNGNLSIIKTNKPNEEGKYSYKTEDTYVVTYVYNNQAESAVIDTVATEKIKTIANTEISVQTEVNRYEVNAEVGSIVDLQVGIPQEINKGYMYTNLNRSENKLDTNYNEIYRMNIGYAELTDKIIITEDSTTLNDENKNVLADINSEIKTTKVRVSKDEIKKVLGENGTIIVRNEKGENLGKLNKDVEELNINANKVSFEASKPEKEGNIDINLDKQILGSVNYTKDGLGLIKELSSQVTVCGYNGENEITKTTINGTIGLTNPTSKGSVETNIDTLSTVTNNENVVFNITLNKTDISDALYTNPAIRITLPSQVKNIDVISARVVYDEELNAGDIQVNGNEIIIYLRGVQTQYNTLSTTQGTLVKVVTNLGLDYLLPSSIENVKVELFNEATGEMNSVEKQINIVAPSDFIRTHEIKIGNESRQAIDQDVDTIKIKTGEEAKTMEVSGQVINNLGKTANGFAIIGRIPFEGNKTISGQELGTNINTSIVRQIEVEGIENPIIMYSNNGEETIEGQNWTTEPIQDAKSFKIESTTGLNDKQLVKFNYAVAIPENLDYERTGKFNYAIVYNNNAQYGLSRNAVEAKTLGFETGVAPTLKMGVTVVDTNEGYQIKEGGDVREGQYLTYRIKVANTGTRDANNVILGCALPGGITLVTPSYNHGNNCIEFVESTEKFLYHEIGTILGGGSEEYELTVKISDRLDDEEKLDGVDLPVAFSLIGDVLGEDTISTVYTVKNKPGYFSVKLNTDTVGIVETNDEINYVLDVINANYDDKTNLIAKIKLPSGVKYTGIDEEYQNSVEYDEKNDVLNLKLGTLSNDRKKIKIKTKNECHSNTSIKAEATLSCDGLNGEIKSNTVDAYTQDPKSTLKVVQTTNDTRNLSDSDDVIFYTDITNEGLIDQIVTFKDELTTDLGVDATTVTLDGNVENIGKSNYINTPVTIPVGKTVRITTKAKSYPIEEGKFLQVENTPSVFVSSGDVISGNTVSIGVRGTAPKQSDAIIKEGIRENSIIRNENQKYKISGKVWFDENKNGKKDVQESGIKDIKLQLYNVVKNEIAKEALNNDLYTISGDDGAYLFENLKPGNYVVVANYDNEQYEIANYKVDKMADSENSDFVSAKLENRDVAATESMEIKYANIYSIDLGLTKKEQFKLDLDQTVSKITISSEKNGVRVISYDNKEAEFNVSDEELKKSSMLVEYNIKVTNNGNISGYAKQIMNSIPKGMIFNSEINPDWYLGKDGNIYTHKLEDQSIKPGENKDIKLILTKHIKDEQVSIYRGRAEIEEEYNEKGLQSINALSGYNTNFSATDVVIKKQSNVRIIAIIGLSIAIVSLIGLGVFEIKKHFIDKLYNYDELDFIDKK